ncbi:MAG: nuclear transport factor 2 family protein [Bacteroidales bacterium]|nr:nuclear transport factor 2 family protein [Bacteroidales bacterium]
MKTLCASLMLSFILLAPAIYGGDDETAVSETVQKELKAFLDKDFETWSACWLHEPYVTHLTVGAIGLDYKKSWDSLSVYVQKEFEKEGNNFNIEILKEDIHVFDNMAIVYAKEKVTYDFLGIENEFKIKSTSILKKDEGKWKFVSVTAINKSSYENNDFTTEWQINMAGYKMVWTDQLDKAIKIFQLNTELFPEAFNTWDSLAEANMLKGDYENAIKYYEKSMALNANNTHAREMIEKMKAEK